MAISLGLGMAPAATAAGPGTGVARAQGAPAQSAAWLAAPAGIADAPLPVLRQGSNSSTRKVTVRSLQYLLNAHGAGLAVDGIFGWRTAGAVKTFQRSRHLTVDGIVGQRTWHALFVTVRQGSTGPAVRAVQDQFDDRYLRAGGAASLAIDGIFGPRTLRAVLYYQNRAADYNPFQVDGIVGPQTWAALIHGYLPRD
nr:peptidoglycan-binding protein [Nakamurella panacisegetis]